MSRTHTPFGRLALLAVAAAAALFAVAATPPGRASAGDDRLTPIIARLLADPKTPYLPAEGEPGPFPLTTVADRMRSANNLKQIGVAMHTFASVNNDCFPAAAIVDKNGKALLSWRVMLLPYVEQDSLFRQFKLDEPWDSAHNKKLLPLMPQVYAPTVRGRPPVENATYYQVFAGTGTMFDPKQAQNNGPLTLGTRIVGVTDGTSNTAMVVEAGYPVPWTKPEDVPYDEKKALPVLGGLFKQGFHVLMGDGSVRFVGRRANPDALRALITASGGEVIDWNDLPAPRPVWRLYNPR